jgi:two-component system chemotaxis sensor kinase CheA
MTLEEAFLLTSLPGFSTAARITDVSGRGVGMDAVRASLQSLGGSLSINSEIGRGSRITLRLPVSIAIINVLLVSTGNFKVALPAGSVLRTLEITKEQILVRDRHPYLLVDEAEIPLKSLNRIMGVPLAFSPSGFSPVLLLMLKGRPGGVLVDKVLGQYEIHMKPLGRPLNRLKGLAGAGMMGDGEIVFVLEPSALL